MTFVALMFVAVVLFVACATFDRWMDRIDRFAVRYRLYRTCSFGRTYSFARAVGLPVPMWFVDVNVNVDVDVPWYPRRIEHPDAWTCRFCATDHYAYSATCRTCDGFHVDACHVCGDRLTMNAVCDGCGTDTLAIVIATDNVIDWATMTRNVIVFAVITFASIGCTTNGPTKPTASATIRQIEIPSWHGRPATMPDGSIVTICATQPREYHAMHT